MVSVYDVFICLSGSHSATPEQLDLQKDDCKYMYVAYLHNESIKIGKNKTYSTSNIISNVYT